MSSTPANPLDAFDPNAKPKYPWATYCPGRYSRGGGPFKIHSALAHAMAALKAQGSGVLYEYGPNNRWVEVIRINPVAFRPERCGACGRSTMEHPSSYNYQKQVRETRTDMPKRNTIRQVVERKNGKLVKPLNVLSLCPDCARGMGY